MLKKLQKTTIDTSKDRYMKSIILTPTQVAKLNRKPLVGRAIACKPRGTVYSNRGTALQPFIKDL